MELIPVLDLARGSAVHAIGGDRLRYGPVQSVLAPGREGDAMALAQAYRALPGVGRCYVADLDAIGGAPAQLDLLARLQSAQGFGGPLLLDAGIASLGELHRLGGAFSHIVVGLETLSSFADLGRLAAQVEVTFSLDLRNDLPLTRPELLVEMGSVDATVLARAAVEAGARSLILLDVGRVGHGVGVNLQLLASLRRALPKVVLLAGGGVRGDADINALAASGCDGVLVATALHRGTLTALAAPPGQSGASEVR
jgi:phosphoribosylformimino-5-aminoimidazole carboxamide ribotide isomerase